MRQKQSPSGPGKGPQNKVSSIPAKGLSPSDIVIFGGTGDLALRKIVPALYYRLRDGQLPAKSRILLLGRQEMTREQHRKSIEQACARYIAKKDFNAADFAQLA